MTAATQKEAWIDLPTEDEVRAAAGGRSHPYEAFMGGRIARMGRLVFAHPAIGPAMRQLSSAVLFGPGALSRPERELVAAVTAAAQRCHY